MRRIQRRETCDPYYTTTAKAKWRRVLTTTHRSFPIGTKMIALTQERFLSGLWIMDVARFRAKFALRGSHLNPVARPPPGAGREDAPLSGQSRPTRPNDSPRDAMSMDMSAGFPGRHSGPRRCDGPRDTGTGAGQARPGPWQGTAGTGPALWKLCKSLIENKLALIRAASVLLAR